MFLNTNTSDFLGYEISCNGGSDGSIELLINGGCTNPPNNYQIEWTAVDLNSAPINLGEQINSQNLTNLSAGTYSVLVTDDNLCFEPLLINLTEPPLDLEVTYENPNSDDFNGFGVACYGDENGEIVLNISGGIPPYDVI